MIASSVNFVANNLQLHMSADVGRKDSAMAYRDQTTDTVIAAAPGRGEPGWRFLRPRDSRSLSEVHATIAIPQGGSWVRRLLAFSGPGYMVSVGYMDPGNWATDLAGGSKFGYTLLAVIMISNLMAILLQALSARLGIATGRDLAQACRDAYPRPVGFVLWFACELAIVACDLAEVIGTAIALKLLFGIPLIGGALITALDAFLVLALMSKGFRFLEAFIVALLIVIATCFLIQIVLAAPPVAAVLGGFVPSREIVTNPEMLYIAIGIIGATVMPHNLYLHSAIVQTRRFEQNEEGRRSAIRWATTDSTIALMLALFVNAAILIVAAAVFHANGKTDVAEIEDAYRLLSPLLGVGIASVLFAVALLASGLNSTVTATLAGQIVMEGFLDLRLPHWARRLLTRAIAIVPVVVVTALYGERGTGQLLIFSQVILSMQLPFAVIPLVQFVSDRKKMGTFAISRPVAVLAWIVAAIIVVLNVKLLLDTFIGA
jgi:manganese transport protein